MFSFSIAFHKSVMLDGASKWALLATTPENSNVPDPMAPDAHVWWELADNVARAEWGYTPVRYVYKDAADLPVPTVDGNDTMH